MKKLKIFVIFYIFSSQNFHNSFFFGNSIAKIKIEIHKFITLSFLKTGLLILVFKFYIYGRVFSRSCLNKERLANGHNIFWKRHYLMATPKYTLNELNIAVTELKVLSIAVRERRQLGFVMLNCNLAVNLKPSLTARVNLLF